MQLNYTTLVLQGRSQQQQTQLCNRGAVERMRHHSNDQTKAIDVPGSSGISAGRELPVLPDLAELGAHDVTWQTWQYADVLSANTPPALAVVSATNGLGAWCTSAVACMHHLQLSTSPDTIIVWRHGTTLVQNHMHISTFDCGAGGPSTSPSDARLAEGYILQRP